MTQTLEVRSKVAGKKTVFTQVPFFWFKFKKIHQARVIDKDYNFGKM